MSTVYQIKVQLLGIEKPEIWRRILVPSDTSFQSLHLIIQRAMGWENDHMYSFTNTDNGSVGWSIEPKLDNSRGSFVGRKVELNAKDIALEEFFNASCPAILYTYDFGDNWMHGLTLENADVRDCAEPDKAHCIAGEGCCPPEDCGGIFTYVDLIGAIEENPEKAIAILNDEDMPEDWEEEDKEEVEDAEDEAYSEDEQADDDIYSDFEEVMDWHRGTGVFFAMEDGKPNFTKINLPGIEAGVSKIELARIYPYRQKGQSKYQAAIRKMGY